MFDLHPEEKRICEDVPLTGLSIVKLQWLEHWWLIYEGWFILVLSPYEILLIAQENKYLMGFFLILSWYVLITIASSRGFLWVHSTN